MSHLDRNIDLYRLQASQDMAVSGLNTLSYLLSANATEIKHQRRLDLETFAYGVAGLLDLLAKDLHTNACDISELHDQLKREGVRT